MPIALSCLPFRLPAGKAGQAGAPGYSVIDSKSVTGDIKAMF